VSNVVPSLVVPNQLLPCQHQDNLIKPLASLVNGVTKINTLPRNAINSVKYWRKLRLEVWSKAFASTSLKDSSDTGWCTDTGATSDMTNDTTVLDEFSPYNGNQRVFMGNGQPLSIPRTGSTSSLIASKSLKIYDALLVPCITKKLFSTSKLTRENNCIMFWFYHTGSIWQQEWLGIRHCEKGLYIIDCGHTSFMSSISLGWVLLHDMLSHQSSPLTSSWWQLLIMRFYMVKFHLILYVLPTFGCFLFPCLHDYMPHK